MPGFLAALEKVGPYLAAAKGKVGGGDSIVLTVRLLRLIYGTQASLILLAWYTAWRNEVIEPSEDKKFKYPIPGLRKWQAKYPVTTIGADEPFDAKSLLANAGGPSRQAALTAGGAAQQGVVAGQGLIYQGSGGDLSNRSSLIMVGKWLQNTLGMHVGENPAFGGVSPVHVPGSYHYDGRAIDVSSTSVAKMDAAAHAVLQQLGPAWFTEFIWNGPHPIAIKNGRVVSPSVYAAVWAGHKNHFHIAK